jgi:acyl phosphate:glycerol-3-phosphate acyltransferase
MGHAGTVRSWPRLIVPVAAGYLLGSIPTAVVVGRRRHVDLRAVGDGNPGWWNARQQLGRRAAMPVLVVDVAKGAAAAGVGRLLAPRRAWSPGYAAAGAAMVGHAWPVFAGFRGGRSVATLGGAAAVLSPVTAIAAAGAGLVAGRITGSAATGIRVGYGAYPAVQVLVDGAERTAGTGALMSLVGLRFWMAARPRHVGGRHSVERASAATAATSASGESQYAGPRRV